MGNGLGKPDYNTVYMIYVGFPNKIIGERPVLLADTAFKKARGAWGTTHRALTLRAFLFSLNRKEMEKLQALRSLRSPR
jgi:hypothetical protein